MHDGLRDRIDYDYDPVGNLLDNTGGKSRGLVEGNRLKVWQDIRFEYDAWGNVSRKRKGTHSNQRFSFDAEDRLVAVTTEDAQGVTETRFEYDPIGRRIASSEQRRRFSGDGPVQRKRFFCQDLRMVKETRSGQSYQAYRTQCKRFASRDQRYVW